MNPWREWADALRWTLVIVTALSAVGLCAFLLGGWL